MAQEISAKLKPLQDLAFAETVTSRSMLVDVAKTVTGRGTDSAKAIQEKAAGIKQGGELDSKAQVLADAQKAAGGDTRSMTEKLASFAEGNTSLESVLGLKGTGKTAYDLDEDERKEIAEQFEKLQAEGNTVGSAAGLVKGIDAGEIEDNLGFFRGALDKGLTAKGGRRAGGKLAGMILPDNAEKTAKALETLGVGSGDVDTIGVDLKKLEALSSKEYGALQADDKKREALVDLAEVKSTLRDDDDKAGKKKGKGGDATDMKFTGVVVLKDTKGADLGTLDMSNVTASPMGG